jgi:glycosyltransferase involved in cell wall biosynthesis
MSAVLPRILVINNTTLLSAGTTRSLVLILKYLRHKYDFTVAAPTHSEGLPAVLAGLGIPFHGLESGRFGLPLSVFSLLRRTQYDLVYANNHEDEGRWAFWVAKLRGLPFVWHVREPVRRRREAWTVKYSNAVIGNSQYTADALISAAGVRSPVAIPNGIEPDEFGADRAGSRAEILDELDLPSSSLLVVSVGILSHRKNQLDAVDVIRLVREKYPEVRLVFIGTPSLSDPDYANRLRARIKQLELTDSVFLLGLRANVVPYLAAADLLLHTSISEPQGRAILEAMAARLPVVAYGVGGIPESVVDGETGLLVTQGDVGAAAEAVCRLVADPALRSRMGEAGRRRVFEHFTAEATARKVDMVIQSVIQRRRPRSG